MDFGTTLIAVAAIGAWYSLRSQRGGSGMSMRRRHRDRNDDQAAPEQFLSAPSPRENELEREVEALRERIHVLERIATDDRRPRALAEEIESLRGN